MATIGMITSSGENECIEAMDKAGFFIRPKSFSISNTFGSWSPERTNYPVTWYKAEINGITQLGVGTIELVCTIPGDAAETSDQYAEIQLYAEDSEGKEFFFGFGQPGNPPFKVDPIAWTVGDTLEIRLQIMISPMTVDQVFEFKYSQVQEIEDHNLLPAAHPQIQEMLKTFGIFMFQTDNIYGGQWIDPYPIFNKNIIHDGDWVYKASDGKYYLAIADGTEKQTMPGQMRIRASGVQGGEGRVIYGGLVEIGIDIEQGGRVYLSDTEAGKVIASKTGRDLGIYLGDRQCLIFSASSGDPYELPISSKTVLGGVKIDEETIEITEDGTISAVTATPYELPIAGKEILGGVKIDEDTIEITEDGTISAVAAIPYELPIATEETLGGVTVDGNTIVITAEGEISAIGGGSYDLPIADIDTLGGVKPDDTTVSVDINTGVLSSKQYSLPIASNTVLGGIKVDNSTITIVPETGVISAVGGGGGVPFAGSNTQELTWPTNSTPTMAIAPQDCWCLMYGSTASTGRIQLSVLVEGNIRLLSNSFETQSNSVIGISLPVKQGQTIRAVNNTTPLSFTTSFLGWVFSDTVTGAGSSIEPMTPPRRPYKLSDIPVWIEYKSDLEYAIENFPSAAAITIEVLLNDAMGGEKREAMELTVAELQDMQRTLGIN
jgi:flagellar basal body rod protein FlgF